MSKIDDGDTIILQGRNNAEFIIRFSDLDTPEVSHPEFTPRTCKCTTIPFRPGQAGGKAARSELEKLVALGEEVSVECYELDIYGRSVCHVFRQGSNINLEIIKSGWGWLPSKVDWVRDPDSKAAQQDAKTNKRGAWGLKDQLTPADWRKQCWELGNCEGAEN